MIYFQEILSWLSLNVGNWEWNIINLKCCPKSSDSWMIWFRNINEFQNIPWNEINVRFAYTIMLSISVYWSGAFVLGEQVFWFKEYMQMPENFYYFYFL